MVCRLDMSKTCTTHGSNHQIPCMCHGEAFSHKLTRVHCRVMRSSLHRYSILALLSSLLVLHKR